MDNAAPVSFFLAFAAGVLTFASPCVFPLIPAYLSYITGVSFSGIKEADKRNIQRKALVHSVFFVLGFSLIFIALGASAPIIGRAFFVHKAMLARAGGFFVVFFGLYIMDIFKVDILGKDRRITLKSQKGSKLGAFLLGITFAAAWTPCAGPILGSILIYAGAKETMLEGICLLGLYSLGIGIPFIVSAFLINLLLSIMPMLNKYLAAVKYICGILLVLTGILLVTNRFGMIK